MDGLTMRPKPKLLVLAILTICFQHSEELHIETGFNQYKFQCPQRLEVPLDVAPRQMNSGSPPEPYSRSKLALQLPILSHAESSVQELLLDIQEGLRHVFQTKNELTLAVHGTGSTAMQAVMDNLIEPGDKVLVAICGLFGDILAETAERLGAQVIRLRKAPGSRFSLEDLMSAVKQHKPNILAIVHGESSTGVYQPLDGLGDLCRREGCLLVTDSVAVIGMQLMLMDKWKVDAAFTSSQKGIGSVVGMAPLSLSDRAVERIRRRKIPSRGYQTDLVQENQIWTFGRNVYHSLSVPLLYSLREALAHIGQQGLHNVYRRHENATLQLEKSMEELGLKYFVENPDDRMVGITTYQVPRGKDVRKIASFIFSRHRIEISTGLGELAGRMLRFATFGTNADPVNVNNLVTAVKEAMDSPETNVD